MPPQQGPKAEGSAAAELIGPEWLQLCRRAVEAQRQIFAEVSGIAERTQYEGRGEGGDRSLVIDLRAEETVFDELDRLAAQGHSFVAVSEERGEVDFGADGAATRVVIDPIDGSLNARRMIPSHSLSIAVASGPSMDDVELGYVYDFGAGEEFVAWRGRGATVDGVELRAEPLPDGRLEVVGLEAAKPELVLPATETLVGKVFRLRGIGSIAINLAYVGAGRLDGMIALRPCRSVDAAAGQLIAREAGALVAFGEGGLGDAGLGLDQRYPVIAATGEQGLETLYEAQRAVEEAR